MPGKYAQRTTSYGPGAAEPNRPVIAAGVEDLARALSESDRKQLLSRIERALSVEDKDQQRIIHGELQQERRVELIAADMNKLGFWERLRFWVKKVMSGGRDQEVFLRFRLDQAKERIREAQRTFVDFDNRVLLPRLPEMLRDLARTAHKTRPFFEVIWDSTDSLRGVLDVLLARRIPDAKRTLQQFCSTQEMQEVFRSTESRNQLKKLVLDRVSEYVDRIPPSVMDEIETGLKGLYLLKDVSLFDFDRFFVQFQSTAAEAIGSGQIEFHQAAAHRVLDSLEELYLALYSVSRIQGDPGLYPELIDFYYALKEGRELPVDGELSATKDTTEMRKAIKELAATGRAVRKSIPLVDIIRFFRNDPYYRFLAYVPRLKLRDFYYSNLKIRVLEELDARFNDIRMGVLGQMVQEVFPHGLLQFEYFHPEIQSGIHRTGIGRLEVYRSLQIVHSFIQRVYRGGLHEFMRILGKIIPVRTRQTGVDFTLLIAGLEDVEERLREFDLSFSPDSEEGKTFYRYRHTSADRDPTQLTAYRGLVNQKARDAKNIIEKFSYQLSGIHQSLLLIKKGSHSHLNERYRGFDATSASDKPFDDRLDEYLATMMNTEKILKQMIVIESET
ncbi:MAG: DUF5312 family protein [Spirochaeta sp.]|jgi:hypothetical protein|nr:DUF5312 family protein [Spirochaeta sp.]